VNAFKGKVPKMRATEGKQYNQQVEECQRHSKHRYVERHLRSLRRRDPVVLRHGESGVIGERCANSGKGVPYLNCHSEFGNGFEVNC